MMMCVPSGNFLSSASVNPALHTTAAYYINSDTAAVLQLLESRVFDDFPTLKIVIPHGGGAVPYQLARYRGINAVAGREPFEEAIKKLYFDTAIYSQDAVETQRVVQHMLLG